MADLLEIDVGGSSLHRRPLEELPCDGGKRSRKGARRMEFCRVVGLWGWTQTWKSLNAKQGGGKGGEGQVPVPWDVWDRSLNKYKYVNYRKLVS